MSADTFDPHGSTTDSAESAQAGRPLQLELVELGDSAAAWSAAGFTVTDHHTIELGRTTICCSADAKPFHGWGINSLGGNESGSGLESIDGLKLLPPQTRTSPAISRPTPPHPNGISSIDHIVVTTGNCDRSIKAFESAGFVIRGERNTTSYGSPMRQVFFWAGDVIVELMGPAKGQAVREAPASVFGLALVTTDMQRTSEVLGDLLGTPKDAVQPGRKIAGLRTKSVGIGLPIAVMSQHRPQTPHLE
jgi:hypothetical protein